MSFPKIPPISIQTHMHAVDLADEALLARDSWMPTPDKIRYAQNLLETAAKENHFKPISNGLKGLVKDFRLVQANAKAKNAPVANKKFHAIWNKLLETLAKFTAIPAEYDRLRMACERNAVQLVGQLIAQYRLHPDKYVVASRVWNPNILWRVTLLGNACFRGQKPLAQCLIGHGANPNFGLLHGEVEILPALFVTAASPLVRIDKIAMMQFLVKNGARPLQQYETAPNSRRYGWWLTDENVIQIIGQDPVIIQTLVQLIQDYVCSRTTSKAGLKHTVLDQTLSLVLGHPPVDDALFKKICTMTTILAHHNIDVRSSAPEIRAQVSCQRHPHPHIHAIVTTIQEARARKYQMRREVSADWAFPHILDALGSFVPKELVRVIASYHHIDIWTTALIREVGHRCFRLAYPNEAGQKNDVSKTALSDKVSVVLK